MEKENRFKYSKNRINEMIAESNIEHVAAKAIGDGLRKLKTMLEDFYNDNNVFYFGYELADISYFNYTPREIENMYEVSHGIDEDLLHMYALILAGLGEKME